ncbi:MAG: hypothetical protein NT062_04430 [Proteobacteria bacterium]|nr:hypothetical protein [Pseudomonadota bacterium]
MSNARLRWLLICVIAGGCSSKTAPPAPEKVEVAASSATKPDALPASDLYDSAALGALDFKLVEGTPAARAHFTRGLLALHSFWYEEATKEFDAAIVADPTMRMGYWGAAMSRCKLVWGDDDIGTARKLLSRMPTPQLLPLREQAWVAAAVALLTNGTVRESRQRFLTTMEALHAKFPDDESATFLALALLSTTRPEDPDTVAVRTRAAALASGVFEHNPKHPGAAHYLLHAYDMPELASLALPYARAYAKVAPAAYHARHMPAHIFSRLGMWSEAITSCQSAWDASLASAQRDKLSADHHDFHSLTWMLEMDFELGHRKASDAAMAIFAKAVRDGLGFHQRSLYATQVASYMARTGDWARVDELLAPLDSPAVAAEPILGAVARSGEPASVCSPGSSATNDALVVEMYALDARARAASAQHDLVKTKRLGAEMEVVLDKLQPFFEATQPKEVVDKIHETHLRHGRALIARASGDDRALLEILRESVVDSDLERGGEMNPSGFIVHEDIADTLLRLKQPKDALVEYTLVLDKHPNRASAVLGAARALAMAGDATGARTRYQQLLELWSTADEGTAGLAEARAAVASR